MPSQLLLHKYALPARLRRCWIMCHLILRTYIKVVDKDAHQFDYAPQEQCWAAHLCTKSDGIRWPSRIGVTAATELALLWVTVHELQVLSASKAFWGTWACIGDRSSDLITNAASGISSQWMNSSIQCVHNVTGIHSSQCYAILLCYAMLCVMQHL